jgi:hypothetical protein
MRTWIILGSRPRLRGDDGAGMTAYILSSLSRSWVYSATCYGVRHFTIPHSPFPIPHSLQPFKDNFYVLTKSCIAIYHRHFFLLLPVAGVPVACAKRLRQEEIIQMIFACHPEVIQRLLELG